MKYQFVLLVIMFNLFISCISLKQEEKTDYVPDEQTAIKIAEAIWIPIYGENVLYKKPFRATLINNKVWRVEGSLKEEEVGGVPIIEIQKSDCKIILVTHGK